jgi:uncharacterized membrane protein YjgN (DUF898 family)
LAEGIRVGITKAHLKILGVFVVAGACIFTLFLAAFQASLYLAGRPPDSSVYNFYPIMALAGAAFGFERWWAHEQGGVNPFHDRGEGSLAS